MSSQLKVLVILSSNDVDKILTGLLWATNALKYKWASDVKLIFFGPSEKLLSSRNDNILKALKEFLSYANQRPLACKFIAEKDGTLNILQTVSAEFGVDVVYVGSKISSYISEGYVPLVF
ncbi:MAG: hypothetical protein C0171_02740 [Caldisphaera sp.]|jgi:hypothetical protein|uniref:hypothetical protein n=1 Tax=Caldisphaera sp. TaxID=2060322 RepID=UPI000CB25361|nr:MAG: hypothetical protein C0171_02740 [Caldisphaera sp.]